MRIIKTDEPEEWNCVLQRVHRHDFYHTVGYHSLAEQRREGTAHLFVHERGEYIIAIPLLLRSLEAVPGLQDAGKGLKDATSLYGYAGPIASHTEVPPSVVQCFQAELAEILKTLRVVSVFSRLHPLLAAEPLLAGLGECQPVGRTVSIDLTLPEEVQVSKIRTNHLRDIRKLQRSGMKAVEDKLWHHLPSFVSAYIETMKRVHASDYYFFDQAYFETLRERLSGTCHLFVVESGTEVACGGFFVACGGILQYHLGGTTDKFLRHAPMKLLFDAVRHWGISQGLEVLHLGGGVAGQEDPLFHFKAGFSDITHPFMVWRWILNPEIYATLCCEKGRWNEMLRSRAANYFPAYRAQTAAFTRPASNPLSLDSHIP